ncbi:MAG: hypothetical protein V4492_08065 [Chlamydiota bacterium]
MSITFKFQGNVIREFLLPELPSEAGPSAPSSSCSSTSSSSSLYCDEEILSGDASSRKRERHSDEENRIAPKAQCTAERVLPIAERRIYPHFKRSDRSLLRRQAVSKLYADKSMQMVPTVSYLSTAVGQLRSEISKQIPPSEFAIRFLRYGGHALQGKEEGVYLETAINQLQEACLKLRYPCSEEERLAAIELRDKGLVTAEAVLKRVQDFESCAQMLSEDIFLNAEEPEVMHFNAPKTLK